jgi:hypothetical protein
LDKESNSNPEKYAKFYSEFAQYLKEGICSDYVHKEDIATLLRMESSMLPPGKFTSLPEYLQRMPKEQTDIFYLIVPNRSFAGMFFLFYFFYYFYIYFYSVGGRREVEVRERRRGYAAEECARSGRIRLSKFFFEVLSPLIGI